MSDIAELTRQLDREKIARARAAGVSGKFLAGAELFDDACGISPTAIRGRPPDWDDNPVEKELTCRLEVERPIEDPLAR